MNSQPSSTLSYEQRQTLSVVLSGTDSLSWFWGKQEMVVDWRVLPSLIKFQ